MKSLAEMSDKEFEKYFGFSVSDMITNKVNIDESIKSVLNTGLPCIKTYQFYPTPNIILKVIKDYAKEMNAQVIMTSEAQIKSNLPIIFNYKSYLDITLKTSAIYQVENVACVLDVEVESSSKAVLEESSVNADTRCECLLPCEVLVANLRDECARLFVV